MKHRFYIDYPEIDNYNDMLRIYREFRELTQEEVAEEINISLRQYQRLENDSSNIKSSHLEKLIKVLGIRPLDIEIFLA